MRERRRGPLGRATGIAEGVAAAVRRAQRDREPRVLLYDGTGRARRLGQEMRGYDEVLELCERIVDLVEPRRREPPAADG